MGKEGRLWSLGARRAYARGRIYADAAASTPIDRRVKKRLVRLLDLYANPGALHKEALVAQEALEHARTEIAETLGAHPDEIYFTGSGTESNDLALLGVLRPLLRSHTSARKDAPPLHAITINIEHASVLTPLAHLQRSGLALSIIPVEHSGIVGADRLIEAIRPETALICVQLVNSEIGTIQPIREIMKAVRFVRKERAAAGNDLPLLVHTDAAQAPLYLPLKVEHLGIDLMTLDAQKMLGPKGVGVLYRRRGVESEPIMFGGQQESGLRPGTQNVALIGACAEALMLAQQDTEKRAARTSAARDLLLQEIQKMIPDAQINGSMRAGERVANNLNLSIPGLEGEIAVIALDALGVCISTRSACSGASTRVSHVIEALDVSQNRAKEAIRITLLPTAAPADVRRIAKALVQARVLYGKIQV